MKTMSIDLETYSSADLSKCGVYKYVEAPDFDIILFAYSVDGGEVQVADLAQGEKIPTEMLSALEDESVIKYAFNPHLNASVFHVFSATLLGTISTRHHGAVP